MDLIATKPKPTIGILVVSGGVHAEHNINKALEDAKVSVDDIKGISPVPNSTIIQIFYVKRPDFVFLDDLAFQREQHTHQGGVMDCQTTEPAEVPDGLTEAKTYTGNGEEDGPKVELEEPEPVQRVPEENWVAPDTVSAPQAPRHGRKNR
jgi:hypothetical protein